MISSDGQCFRPCVAESEGPPTLPLTGPSLKELIPSRGREITPILYMAASGTQPGGEALPSLLPSPILTMEDHVNFATILNPVSDLMGAAIPQSSWKVGKDICQNPKAVIEGRLSGLKFLSEISEKLSGQNAKWISRLPEGSPAGAINFALIHFLCKHLNYPDTSLPADLTSGMPVVGQVPVSGVFHKRARPANVTLPDWRVGLRERNLCMVERARKSAGSEEARLCWEKTLKEVNRGWVTKPVPVTDQLINTTPLSHRFAIVEEHEGPVAKIRVVDDFKASKVNDLLSMEDTSVPENLDVFFGMASMFAQLGCARPLKACVMDFAHAYKHVGILPSQVEFATIVLADYSGTPMVASLRTQPFGSSRAPANWARVTNLVQFVLLKLCNVWLGIYVGDCFCVEPEHTIASASNCIKAVCALLGLQLEPSKEQTPSDRITLLGAAIQINQTSITASLPEKKQRDYIAVLRGILARNSLTPAAAARVRGKLGFAQSLMFGKYGRALLHEFSARQYTSALGPKFPLTVELRETITWWADLLPRANPRAVKLRPPPPVVVYTDAEGSGHVAAALFDTDQTARMVSHTHAPKWMRHQAVGAGIFEYELLAVCLGVMWALTHFPGRPILLCADNLGARGAIIRGTCKTRLGRALSSYLWKMASIDSTLIWVEYVKSKLNVADAPSRACVENNPVNEFTKGVPVTEPPTIFLTQVGLEENLFKLGMDPKPVNLADWNCPVHVNEKRACDPE